MIDPVKAIYDNRFYERASSPILKFLWLPETCHLTGKRLWLKKAYRLTRMITGPGDPVFEHRWHDKNAHIIWQLKK